ncbi:MAG: AraC family transcriptional regulator [Lachnospiraceae bacterium]|nr:AraC family transcriptional regulator [Lachnospiraceae bacterium]
MAENKRTGIPEQYKQPDDADSAFSRTVRNSKELVYYTLSTHIRIWYNNQTDGYAIHSHDAFEMCLCIKNNYEIHVNNEIYVLNEGDILIIPPHTLHEVVNFQYGIRFIYLLELNHFYKSQDYKTIEPLLFNAFLCNSETCPDIYDNVYRLLMEMNTVYFTNSNFWETTVYIKMYQVFAELAKHSENAVKEETHNLSQSINRINALLRYIDINYSEDISTEQAAEYTGFSKYHFLRLFKLQTGYTFHDYLTLKRMRIAEDLLLTDISVTEIAFQTGFNTLPSFCRTFKKYTNYSPSEYKKLRLATLEDNKN